MGKSRFDNVDVMAMVSYLNQLLIGRRVINIYEGDTNDAFIFKLDHQGGAKKAGKEGGGGDDSSGTTNKEEGDSAPEKPLLYMQSGIRFHVTQMTMNQSNDNHKQLSPFVMKLRKNLRGLRLEFIKQLGTDRVVQFIFGSGDLRRIILLELYAKGNLLLCDQNYSILSLLRSHQYHNNQVQVQVGHVYPVTYATNTVMATTTAADSISTSPSGDSNKPQKDEEGKEEQDSASLVSMSVQGIIQWAKEQIQLDIQKAKDKAAKDAENRNSNKGGQQKKKKKNSKDSAIDSNNTNLKTLLLKPSSGFSQYGPSFLEHCILCSDQKPHVALTEENLPSEKEWESLISVLKQQSVSKFQQQHNVQPGYIFYSPKKTSRNDDVSHEDLEEKQEEPAEETKNIDALILEEFQPYLLKQHEGRKYIQYANFSKAVDMFFSNIENQRRRLKAEAAENAAQDKLEKIRQDQLQRVQALEEEQDVVLKQAEILQYYADDVEKALMVINSALDNGMDWEQLEQLVHVEQTENNNPIAKLIYKLELEKDTIVLSLPDITSEQPQEEDQNEGNSMVQIPVSLKESAHANASALFTKYRNYKEKSKKTIEASEKAMKAAEEVAKKQLMDAQKRTKQTMATNLLKRKSHWFEKFLWFITSDNYLVLGGRDAHQNELLVKKYLRKGDAYLHADVHGAASCILRAKRRRIKSKNRNAAKSTTTQILPLSDQALREAGNFTICRSSAWTSKMVTSAWYVESHQVSKTAPTGEYLKVGAFMIRGKKTFLPPSTLEMGIAVVFRLGDNESIARHKNDRRDFALLQLEQQEEEVDSLEQEEEQQSKLSQKKQERKVQEQQTHLDETPPLQAEDEKSNFTSLTTQDGADQTEEEIENNLNDKNNNKEDLAEEPSNLDGMDAEAAAVNKAAAAKNDVDVSKDLDNNQDEKKQEEDEKVEKGTGIEDDVEETIEEIAESSTQPEQQAKKKKGFSVRERRLIRKYGSLEKAELALAELNSKNKEKENTKQTKSCNNDADGSIVQQPNNNKRGKKSKMKRAMKKYGDQDDEDRELAMLALQGGEKEKKKNKNKNNRKNKGDDVSNSKEALEIQQKAAAETAALLVKDASKIANDKLTEDVRYVLSECVTVQQQAHDSSPVVRWDKFDADVLETLISLEGGQAAQIAAAKRLLYLKKTTRVDNFSASLAGIIRTIRRYGYENLEIDPSASQQSNNTTNTNMGAGKRKTKQEKQAESSQWKDTLAKEGIRHDDDEINDSDVDGENDAIDDTAENSKLTGKPHPQDNVLYAMPVCGPYSTLSQYTYRIKLTPGNMKRGKAAKQCLEMFTKGNFGDKNNKNLNESCKNLIKNVSDNDWIQAICPDVKIATAGASKVAKKQKSNFKKSKKR